MPLKAHLAQSHNCWSHKKRNKSKHLVNGATLAPLNNIHFVMQIGMESPIAAINSIKWLPQKNEVPPKKSMSWCHENHDKWAGARVSDLITNLLGRLCINHCWLLMSSQLPSFVGDCCSNFYDPSWPNNYINQPLTIIYSLLVNCWASNIVKPCWLSTNTCDCWWSALNNGLLVPTTSQLLTIIVNNQPLLTTVSFFTC